MEFVIVVLVIGFIPAMIASSKGRNFFLWYIYGCALFIIALVHACLLKSDAQKAIEAKALRDIAAPVPTPPQPSSRSAAEEIEQFAKLKDSGALTEEEFQAKKRQLLGL